MNKKKIAIIGTVGLPAKYGGFETLAEHLVEELHTLYDITVFCSGKKYAKAERLKTYKGAKLLYIPLQANGGQSIIYDFISIIRAVFFADVLLVLGVSGAFALPFVKLFTRKKIVVSIDGIEWKRNKWGKYIKKFLSAAERVAVKFSHADIADNEAIQDYTAERYNTLSNIIEYGADHTLLVPATETDYAKYSFLKQPYFFKVCRIEPENNIHMVLSAFAQLPQHVLVLVGNWDKSEYGINVKKEFGQYQNIILLDPIYEQAQLDLLRGNCSVYIHGHSAGGTNPSLVEAMYLGLPVMAFNVSYNVCTTEEKAFYFQSAEELVTLVKTKSQQEFIALAQDMKKIADRRYTWKTIADKYAFLIEKVLQSVKKRKFTPAAVEKLSHQQLLQHEIAHLQSAAYFFEKNR